MDKRIDELSHSRSTELNRQELPINDQVCPISNIHSSWRKQGEFTSTMRMMKIKLPRFNGSDVSTLVLKVDEYFDFYNMPENQWV